MLSMSTLTFDTLEFTRKLREAGFDQKQAETVVRVMADAQSALVTGSTSTRKWKRSKYDSTPGLTSERG